jgi:SAM-dependent methyltransferase
MNTNNNPPVCPICKSSDSAKCAKAPADYEYDVRIAKVFELLACNSCGSEYVNPRPSLEQLKAMYPNDYYAYDQEMGALWKFLYDRRCRAEARRLLDLTPKRPIRLFDVGAGDCRHFRAIGSVGNFEFSGVEMNGDMARAACERGYDIEAATFEEYDSTQRTGSVDILTMNHLIEHVINPEEMLKKAYSLLADDGVFYGRTPKLHSLGNALFGRYWGGYHFPRHLHLFSEKSLQDMLLDAGFREVEIREDLNLFPALSLQNFLLGKLKLPLRLSAGHSRIWTLLVALTTPLSIFDYLIKRGDCMIFVARK